MFEWYLDKQRQHTGFSRAEGGSLAANETTNAHSLLFPPLPALLSFTTPSPLCLSLTPAETLLCCLSVGGWVHRLHLSLSHPTNIELRRAGKKTPIY